MVSKGKERGETLLGAFQVWGKFWERWICWLLFDVFKLFIFCLFFFFFKKFYFSHGNDMSGILFIHYHVNSKLQLLQMWGYGERSHLLVGKEFENKPKGEVIVKVAVGSSSIGLTSKWFEMSKILKSNLALIFFFFSCFLFFVLSSLFSKRVY